MKPIAITLGDPCGIGPEIVLKAFAAGLPAPAVVVGDPALLAREAERLRLPLTIRTIASAEALGESPAGYPAGPFAAPLAAPPGAPPAAPLAGPPFAGPGAQVPVIATTALPDDLPVGSVDARAGDAAYRCIARAAMLAMRGEVRAVVTAPINKEALHRAGHDYPGHTELLAELAGNVPVRMMLANHELRTVLVTIHLALRDALNALSRELIGETIAITHDALRRAGIASPRIAVAGVNPHAGEGGAFGREEIDLVAPAIADARARGIDATGPHPPDTVFMQARGFARYDVVVAMYHDQGLIPVKYLGIEDGVNITIGLPYVRTSPDHGTAFDIAGRLDAEGRGLADPRSLLGAIRQADALAAGPRRN
jgi:4-hydroxythreonine-4-phosphate dehydrogenase